MGLILVVACVLIALVMLVGVVTMFPLLIPLALVGATMGPPGVVPPAAGLPPHGPLPGEGSALMVAIQPWMNTPYVFGGNGPPGINGAVDCSGFTQQVERQLGFAIPRTAQLQYNATDRISFEQALPNDLVFFFGTYDSRPDWISHVGIYIGDGMMVSAIQPRLGRQSLNDAYWRAHFAGFGRIRR